MATMEAMMMEPKSQAPSGLLVAPPGDPSLAGSWVAIPELLNRPNTQTSNFLQPSGQNALDEDAFLKLWGPPSGDDAQAIDKRFKEKGQARLSLVRRVYIKGPSKTLALYDKQGNEALKRDAVNLRQQMAAVIKYARELGKHGLMILFRSALIARAESDEDNCEHFYMASGGTLVEACYYAFKHYSSNDNVKAILEEGFPGVMILFSKRPMDVLKWLKVEANPWMNGSSWTLIECTEETILAEASWNSYKESHSVPSARSTGGSDEKYVKLMEKHVMEKWSKERYWPFFICYQRANRLRHYLDGEGMYEVFKRLVEKEVDVLCPRLDIHVAVQNISNLFQTLLGKKSIFLRAYSKEVIHRVFFVIIKLLLPLIEPLTDQSGKAIEWLTAGRLANQEIKMLLTPMRGNKWFKNAADTMRKVAEKRDANKKKKEEPKTKKNRLPKEEVEEINVSKDLEQLSQETLEKLMEEVENDMSLTKEEKERQIEELKSTTRDKVLLDDLLDRVMAPVSGLPQSKVDWVHFDKVVALGVAWCWAHRKVILNTTRIKKEDCWTSARNPPS